MNRILPVLLIVALLVVGGIWLSRPNRPQEATAETTTPGTVQAQTDSDTDTSDDGSGTDTSESGDTAEPDTTEPDTAEPGTTETATETTEPEGTSGDMDTTEDSSTESSDTTTTEEPTTDAATTDAAATDTATTQPAVPTPPEGFTLTPFLSETQQREFTQAEQVLEPDKDYQAIIVTNKGNMRLDLFEDQAPKTVNNFIFLARNHFYDGVVFHRVLQDFMAQTGDPTGTGTGGPGYQFEDEIVDTLKFDKRGLLAMANSGPGTNGSQFFITFVETPHLNGLHTIFGELVEGDDVLSNIKLIDPSQGSQPSVIAMMTDTLESLAGKGITLAGEPTATLETYLITTLGSLPEIGSEFEVDGFRAVSGRMSETPAVGFYAEGDASSDPDVMQAVYIIEKPKS
jgi:cyclophilin family peptidyl-prolyl cis-trans isomerase